MRTVRTILILLAVLLGSLSCALAEEEPVRMGTINASTLNLRDKPSTGAKWLGTYERDEQVQILEELDGWFRVLAPDGQEGYMAAEFILPSEVKQAGEPEVFTVGSVQQIGTPQALEHASGALTFAVQYPQLNHNQADMALSRWVDNTYAAAKDRDSQTVNTAVQYDSYWVQGRYVGVLELGEMKIPDEDGHVLVYTLNLDTWEDRLLTHQDLFNQDKIGEVLELVRAALEEKGESPVRSLAPDALYYSVLTNDGVTVYMPPVGMMRGRMIELPYAELNERELLAIEIDTPSDEPFEGSTTAAEDALGGALTVDSDKPPMVALTFDDGPGKETPRLLDILAEHEVKATFFIVGNRVSTYPEILLRTAQEGHEIGTHTWSHQKLSELDIRGVEDEIEKSLRAIERVTETPVRLLRPPYGSLNGDVRNTCRRMELTIALWSLDTEDWKTNNAETTASVILDTVQPGDIILCHDLKESTPDAIATVIPELLSRGYQIVTVSELLSHYENGAQLGVAYTKLDYEE